MGLDVGEYVIPVVVGALVGLSVAATTSVAIIRTAGRMMADDRLHRESVHTMKKTGGRL